MTRQPRIDLALAAIFLAGAALSLGGFSEQTKVVAGGAFESISALGAAAMAFRVAQALRGVPEVRPAWLLFAVGLFCFGAGEMGDIAYERPGVERSPPVPPDFAYMAGYVALFVALVRLVRSYWRHFPVSSARELALTIGASGVALALLAVAVVRPMLAQPLPMASKLYLVSYAALDILLLAPMVLLVRVAYAFRGGPVAAAWAVLLGGFATMQAADLFFSLTPWLRGTPLFWADQVLYIAAYLLMFKGAALQQELAR